MDITPFIDHNINIITKYNNYGVYVNDQFIDYDFVLSLYHIDKWQDIDKTNKTRLYEIIIEKIEESSYGNMPIVIVGSNFITEVLHKHIIHLFAKINISPEIMPNRSAYKTYNILASEGRNVVAVLELTR